MSERNERNERTRTKAELQALPLHERVAASARAALAERVEVSSDEESPAPLAKRVAQRTQPRFHWLIRGIDQQIIDLKVKRYDYDATLLTLYLEDGSVELIPWANILESSFTSAASEGGE